MANEVVECGAATRETENCHDPFLTEQGNSVPKQREKSSLEKFKDHEYRRKFLHSVVLSCSSFVLGLVIGQQGPTFLDLLIITGVDLETGSSFFTAASCGYLFGSFVSGFLHGKVNDHIMMVVVSAGAGTAAIITPHCSPFWLMICIRFLTNMFCGGIDTFANAQHLGLWGSEGRALLQFIHFTFALGGMLTPLYTEPFLAEKDVSDDHTTDSQLSINTTAVPYSLNTSIMENTSTSSHNMTISGDHQISSNVHYAFLITGILSFLASIPYIVLYFTDKSGKSSSDGPSSDEKSRKVPLPLRVFMIIVLCLLYVVYCCVEDTFASFLMTFVVNEYDHVTKSKGAYMTTFYWASFAVGRFLSIFLAKYMRAVRLMYLCSTLMIIAYSAFLVSAHFAAIDALTVFAGLAGVAMSSLFPSGLSWTEAELMPVTGWISSFILIGSSIGMMVNPLILGYLMEEVANMWFCYLLLGETLLMCVIFLFLLFFNRKYVNIKYGPVTLPVTSSVTVVAPPESESLHSAKML
ncbi:sodium-dependent glucose transporter 1C [Aplysia californica]|uniref:Sodium-dependent glucose transporter 1C n=1 Tax=Aplysia californica TaxID=6500 RepID=A0ABM0JAX6_APLCA|nr:sodium-dependent glucose transporter 1C [Aplysia californica]XP_005089501.1 sodium-dependent glucose transporter 1C [Aplysia californica]XP_035824911.1 sodium-dependent glucose transporter 1C [Aplysia californica]